MSNLLKINPIKSQSNNFMLDLSKMKKILIVNTRSSERKLCGMVMWGSWAVASYLDRAIPESDVIYLDENNEDNFTEKFKIAVKDRDTVGFSLTSMQIKYTLPLIRYIKENFSNIKVIVGGIHPVLFPQQDYGALVDEVVTYDFPKDTFDYKFLPEKVKDVYRKKRAQVVTGFNCSYKCAFCVNSVRNCKYEGRQIADILNDIDYVVKEFSPPKIYFRDEDFFQDINKAKAIVNHLLARNYSFKWEATCRVTHFIKGRVDDEFLALMVRSGCIQLRFGIESGSQRVLNYLRKGQMVGQIKFAVKNCVRYGLKASCSFITGIPTETALDREETYKLITELSGYGREVEILGPQIFRPYPGGLLYEEIKKYGLFFPEKFEEWENHYDINPLGDVFDTAVVYPWLSAVENKELPNVWVVAHYGLNYRWSESRIKRIISLLFLFHWKLRWFGGFDIAIFMYLRKKFITSDLD